jgi:hypothetical protein
MRVTWQSRVHFIRPFIPHWKTGSHSIGWAFRKPANSLMCWKICRSQTAFGMNLPTTSGPKCERRRTRAFRLAAAAGIRFLRHLQRVSPDKASKTHTAESIFCACAMRPKSAVLANALLLPIPPGGSMPPLSLSGIKNDPITSRVVQILICEAVERSLCWCGIP